MALKDKVIKYLEEVLGDVSPDTVEVYKLKFSNMSDTKIKDFFKKSDVRFYMDDYKFNEKQLDTLVRRTGVVAEEKIVYPEKNNAISMKKMMVIPVQIRRMQQISATESHSTLDASTRDKVNQATRESRTSKLTDTEVSILASLGMDNTLSEMLSPRSDNQVGKNTMNRLLREKGKFSLKELPNSPKDKNSINYVDILYKCMGVATDLVDNFDDISY